jgi:hypothetical protein
LIILTKKINKIGGFFRLKILRRFRPSAVATGQTRRFFQLGIALFSLPFRFQWKQVRRDFSTASSFPD